MSGIHRRNPKRDKNEIPIINTLRGIGAQVYPISAEGVPDLLVFFRDEIYLLEVKAASGKLTDAQDTFHRIHADCKHVGIVRSPEDALKFIGAI